MASNFQDTGFDGRDDSSLFPAVLAEVVVSLVLTTSFTVARLMAQRSVARFDIVDYFSIASWFVYAAYALLILGQATRGAGQHIWKVPASSALVIAKMSWAIELLYPITCFVAKTALVLQLRRTFAPYKKGAISISCLVLVWAYFGFCFSALVAKLVECVPTAKIWDPTIRGGRCIDIGAVIISEGVVNVVSDLAILVLPLWAIFHLKISLKKKMGVSAVFATGLLAVSASVCRLVWTFPLLREQDTTYLIAPLAMWSLAEISSIILCTCFPLLPRLYRITVGAHKRERERAQSTSRPISRSTATVTNTNDRPVLGFLSMLRSENWVDTDRSGVDDDDNVVGEKLAEIQAQNGSFAKETETDGGSEGGGVTGTRASSVTDVGDPRLDRPGSKAQGYITVHREFEVQHGVDAQQFDAEKQETL